MSWLPNPWKSIQPPEEKESFSDAGNVSGGGSVKEDLSMIGATIGRQLRGVASFLAPPPFPSASDPVADDDFRNTRSPRLIGIRNDLAEISGSFKSSLSLLSRNKAVVQFSKLASNFLQRNGDVGEEEVEEYQGFEISDEALDFVTEISERPEYWTDFPLSLNDDDFTMSDAQAEHISVMEQLVPTLADLRTRLRTDLSEKQFWAIYFILLLPRLNENSLNILSTPEIMKARSSLLSLLQHRRNSGVPASAKDHIDSSSKWDVKCDQGLGESASGELVVSENSKASGIQQRETKGTTEKSSAEEDANTESVDSLRQLQNEDEFSFSDLEDDDTDASTRRCGSRQVQDSGCSSPDGSREWVRLNESGRHRSREGQTSYQTRDSEGEESSDWLTVDEFDNYD